jgi:hypothetical protein
MAKGLRLMLAQPCLRQTSGVLQDVHVVLDGDRAGPGSEDRRALRVVRAPAVEPDKAIICEALQGIGDRLRPIGGKVADVELIEVDSVPLQPAQRRLAGAPNVG